MRGCWARFARTGDPHSGGIPTWPVCEAATDRYMEFGDPVAVKAGLWKQACDLFDELAVERRALRDATPPRSGRRRAFQPRR
jgi:carboxylesterase type B